MFDPVGIGGDCPDGEGGVGTGLESAVELLEEAALVGHVGEGLDGDGGIEGGVEEGVLEPVLHEILDRAEDRGWGEAGMGGLAFGKGEGGDVDVVVVGEPAGGGTVAATDVGEAVARFEGKAGGDPFEEVEGGLLDAAVVVAVVPETVVDMVAPDVAVELVEFVVVTGHVGCGEGDFGGDHVLMDGAGS